MKSDPNKEVLTTDTEVRLRLPYGHYTMVPDAKAALMT